LRERLRADDVAGIEIRGVELDVRVGGGEKVGRETLAASESIQDSSSRYS